VNTNFCRECSGVKIISPEGLPTCSECGLIEDNFVDDSAEWTSGITDDGRVNDPSRDVEIQMQTPSCFHRTGVRVPLFPHNVRQLTKTNGWQKLISICP
jgi:hypothetical protein